MIGTRAIAIVFLCALAAGSLSAQGTFGTGTAGSGGFVPTISSGQAWMGDLGWGVNVDEALGGAPGVLLMGPVSSNSALGPYPLYVDLPTSWPLVSFVTSGPSGVAGAGSYFHPFPLAVPEDPVLAGLHFYFQAAIFDPMGPGGAAVTSGMELTLTMAPRVIVMSSVAGSTDPWTLVDPVGMTTVAQGGSMPTDNVKGAIFTDNGTKLYVESSFNGVQVADVGTSGPTGWTSLTPWPANAGIASRSLQLAKNEKLLWGVGDPGVGSMQLTAIDIDQFSPSYGQAVHWTTNFGTNLVGTFGLSNAGHRACIPSLLGGSIQVWDTDPASPTFLANVDLYEPGIPFPLPQTTIPSGSGSSFWVNNSIAWSPDDSELFILRQGTGSTPSEIARYSFAQGGWVDHDPATPGIQNIGPASVPPVVLGSAGVSLNMAKDGSFLVVSGFGGNGWCGRIDIAPHDPTILNYLPASGTNFTNAWISRMNDESTVVAVSCGSPFRLNFLDAATMTFLWSQPLNMSAATNIAWR